MISTHITWILIIIIDVESMHSIEKTLMIALFDGALPFSHIHSNRFQFAFSASKQSKLPFITVLFSFLHISILAAEVGAKGKSNVSV